MFKHLMPRLRFANAPIAAVDNLTLLAVMQTGDPGTKPGSAAQAFYHETVGAAFRNPTLRNSYLNNAWNLFRNLLSNPREWEGYADRLAVRRMEFGATSLVLDAHGLPTTIQANPNDAQNELRFKKFRAEYRQLALLLNRDAYIPITVDSIQVGRLLAEGANGEGASKFLAAQLTQVLNTDKAQEFNTLWDAFAVFIGNPGIFYIHTADLDPATIDQAEAIAAAVTIRAAVRNLADFTNRYSTAKQPQTVPADQVQLIISVSGMQALGIGYGSAFNPEFVLALPEAQIVEIPDQYWLNRPEFLANQIQWALVDKGSDQGDGGTFVIVDSLYENGADPFNATGTYNQALHHASILDLNPFKTLIVGGPGTGTQIAEVAVVPATITLDIYTDLGVIAHDGSGDLPRGVEFSTLVSVVDASGAPAGGFDVEITGATSPTGSTTMLRYMDGKIGNNETAETITVTATSTIDPAVTVSHTYNLTGPVIDLLNGLQIVDPITFPGVFDAGTGTGGTYTYTAATGVTYTRSATEGGARSALGASPATVATGVTIWVHATANEGYIFADGSTEKTDGPHTAE